ncbi:MAG: hypothetical protein MASP_00301 [Candidatus Methanolliviera sp. GoM_asphalt]|nr:MAG: hypothetical protein MASP_00301 [Candidatus Methanolliviera sp. GoM_asphalt]
MRQRILINRIENGSIEIEDEGKEISVEADVERTDVAHISVKNYGTPVHLYFSVFQVNESLESVVSFPENNFYVEGEDKIPIRIDLPYEKEYNVQVGVTASYGPSKEVFSLKISPKTITSEGKEEIEESHERDFVERIYSEWEIFLFLTAVLFFIIAMMLLLI